MAEKSSSDPAAVWRDLLGQWEKGVNEMANKAMGSAEFSRAMNQATDMSVGVQHQLGELIGKYLSSLNLPSRAEMVAIGERLQAIETSLAHIAAAIGRLGVGASAPALPVNRPPRTRRAAPPSDPGKP